MEGKNKNNNNKNGGKNVKKKSFSSRTPSHLKMSTQDLEEQVAKLVIKLNKQKKTTFKHWRYLTKEIDPGRIDEKLFAKAWLKKALRHLDDIVEILCCWSNATVSYRNMLKMYKDLTPLPRSKLFSLYLMNSLSENLEPCILEALSEKHKRLNIVLLDLTCMY